MPEYFVAGRVDSERHTTIADIVRALDAGDDWEWTVDPRIECAGALPAAGDLADAAEQGRSVTTAQLRDYGTAGVQIIEGWLRRANESMPPLLIEARDGSWWDLYGSDGRELEAARLALGWPDDVTAV